MSKWFNKKAGMTVNVAIDGSSLNAMIEEAEAAHGGRVTDKEEFAKAAVGNLIDRYFDVEYFDVDSDWVSNLVEKTEE